jgi:superfamily II DNA or RNA helicase
MFGGGKKDDEINMVCTWQTLQNNKPFIRDFECIIWDECHTAKAFVAMQIMNEAKNSFIRLGLTGTVPKEPLDKANLMAGFGPVVYDVKAHELQERNILSSIDINIFELLYPKEFVGSFIDWHEETMYLQRNRMFQKFMKALVGSLEGNTLILMKNVDPAEELSEFIGSGYISSKLKVDKRQEKFNEFVYGGNLVTVGTYSLLSTGIDIVHINNLILAPTPGKSMVKTIQSIGRGLRRKGGQKEHVTVIDLTSNMKYDKKHIKERKEFYREAKYPFEVDKIEMEDFDTKKK